MIINGRDTTKYSSSNTNKKDLSYYKSLPTQKSSTAQQKMDNLWVESTAPNVLQKQNINATVKPVNISDFVKGVKNTTEQNKLKVEEDIAKAGYKSSDFTEDQKKQLISGNYSINPTYNPDNKFSQKLIYTGDANIKATPTLGQRVINTAEKSGRTAMDLIGNVATGVTKGMEGYVDTAVGAGGTALSGLSNLVGQKELSQNIKNKAEQIAGYGFAKDMQNLVNEKSQQGAGIYNPSVFGVDVRDAAQEIARMYSVGMTGGLPGLMVSATGGNIEEALNEGESLGRATTYGAISGSLEGIVEKMFDPAKILGGGLKTIGKGFLGKIAEATVGEGAEEGITAALNPFIKMLTYKGDVENPFGSWDNFKNYLRDIGQSVYQGAIIGGLTLGVSAPGNVDLQKSFRDDVHKAVEKIQGVNQARKNEIANTILEGANQTENVAGLQKTEAQKQAQNPNIEQTNVTLPNQAEMAQNANMEQFRDNTKLITKFEQEVDEALENSASKGNIIIGKTNNYIVNKVKQILGVDIANRNHVLSKDYIRHMKKHMNETSKNQIPITIEDIKKVPDIINNPDDVIRGSDTLASDRKTTIPSIRYIKTDTEGRMYVVEAIPNKGNLQIKTMWKEPTELIHNTSVLHHTPEAVNSNLSTTNNSISDNDKNINISENNVEYDIDNDTSTYISPVSDLQGATEFVNKATIKDVETLQKMVEEAEKNPDRIDLQFFAEKAKETIEKLSRQQVRQAIMEETGLDNYNLDDVNKISKAKMNFTTPVRVIEKIFNKETANKINENFFKPIKHNEAERIRRLNKERADIKELDIKPGSAEDAAIQKFGEGEYIDKNGLTIPYTLENLKQDFPETWQKLNKATNVIRNKYDTYLEEINEVLKDNGYDPIPKRKDYFRHFEELNDLFSILGVPTKVDDIPTDLNGMTADLKPGKQFFANALQRKGNKTTYSAIKGIDGYLDGAMNMLYHTKDIQKLRTLEKYIRDTYGTQKGLDDANAMTDEQKNKRINQINEGHLSEFAAWLMEYTNALAGKKSRLDRGIEEMFGRKAYKYLNLIKKQVGANMTGLNVNSALSNFISVTQAAPKTSKKALVKGTVDTVKNIFNKDGFIDKSDFLTTRFGSDKIAKNWWQKAGDVGQIFMSGTDYFTANLITRSKYQEFLDKGYTETEAMKKADEFADRLMAGRGKGDLPTAFESKMLGIVTQFQLEVTNQIDSMFYDTFQENYAKESNSKLAKEHPKFYNAMAGTFVLGQIFALAFLFNEGKEEVTGAEGGAFDPIGTIADAIKYYDDENLSFGEATVKVVEDIANQLPFASIITGGGRLPVKEAFPDLLSVWRGEAKLGDEMWKLTNLLLPTGGGQLKKTTQGLKTFAEGGAYSKDAEGNKKLKYPVEQNLENFAKSALFGKWSTEGAKQYIDSGFKALSANQTEGYEKAKKAGITDKYFYDAYNAQKKADKLGDLTSLVKKNEIDKATRGLSQTKRQILYETFGVAKGEWDNTRIVSPYEIKAQKEKLAREKLKTEKK